MRGREIDWEALGRLPWVSLGLVLALVASFLVLELGYSRRLEGIHAQLQTAVDYAIRNPMVQIEPRLLPVIRGVLPGFEDNEIFAFLKDDRAETAAKQEQFDQIVHEAFERLDAHPYRRLGLVPAAPSLLSFASHVLVHVGWLHVLGAALLLLLAGPLLEESWGPRIHAASLAIATLGAAGIFCLVHASGDRALVGAGAACSALVAAALVRFRDCKVALLRWLAPLREIELWAPIWPLAAIWAVWEAALFVTLPGRLPQGVDSALGYTAHLAGAALGGLVALAVERLGWAPLARGAPARAAAPMGSKPRFDFAAVQRARARGDLDAAYAMLDAEVRRSARHRDAVTLFWQMAVERGEAERAAPAMIQLTREDLRRGAAEMAVSHWRELAQHAPRERVDAATLTRLFPSIRRVDGDEHALIALQQVMDPSYEGPSPSLAAEIAQLAADLDPELAGSAAAIALEEADLDEARRAELGAIRDRAEKDEGPAVVVPPEQLPANAFYEEQDRSGFGEVGDLTRFGGPGAGFPRERVRDAVPVALDADGCALEVSDGPDTVVSPMALSAVAVAGVHGQGARPIVLVDLFVVAPSESAEIELRVYRLRSDRFDPRSLEPDAGSPLAALQCLLERLLEISQARPLPDPSGARANPVRMFASLSDYEDWAASRLHGL